MPFDKEQALAALDAILKDDLLYDSDPAAWAIVAADIADKHAPESSDLGSRAQSYKGMREGWYEVRTIVKALKIGIERGAIIPDPPRPAKVVSKVVEVPVEPAPLEVVTRLCDRLPLAIRRLRTRRAGRAPVAVEDEYDVQYLLAAVLDLHFDDVRAEDPVQAVAGGASRVDYFLKAERIIVETKMTRKSLGEREVGEELIVDIRRYQERADCDVLVCFVYDPEHHIGNPRGLEKDLQATESRLKIRVLVRS